MRIALALLLSLLMLMAIAAAGVVTYLVPRLPSIAALRDVQLQVPLRVYSQDNSLIAEFGEKRRSPIKLSEAPPLVIKAVLAAEDDRFYDHHGVDMQSMARAVLQLLRTGEKSQGGSTITMQVARNFFLSPEKTFLRKVNEILLAIKIEGQLSKDEILELYLNKIYLGQRAYGVAAAAQVYYGVDLKDLTLPQIAMIAGLPKAPSQINPIVDPLRAVERRNYVINRLYERGYIDRQAHDTALASADNASVHVRQPELSAAYVAEMVRSYMVDRYGESVYEAGYRVITTVQDKQQTAANEAVRSSIMEYDRRHGYRGAEHHFQLPNNAREEDWARLLQGYGTIGSLVPAIVITVGEASVTAFTQGDGLVKIGQDGLKLVTRNANVPLKRTLKAGDLIRLQWAAKGFWRLAQLPEVEAALVAMDPNNGAVRALVGGFDFARSKFNRVTQGHRQPGSGFKPFIYSAALDAGYTAASIIDDAPLEIWDPSLDTFWRPENYNHTYRGPTRLRVALAHSRNLVSIRLLQGLGMDKALRHVARFGFDVTQQPRNLSLALGTGSVTPIDLASAYTVFANGGYRVFPYFVQRIESNSGEVLVQARPATVCIKCAREPQTTSASEEVQEDLLLPQAARVISSQNAWVMNSMLQDVIRVGTAKAANDLHRSDLAGKTGTTNDQRDAWFSGYNSRLVATAWMGFDQTKPLGDKETGAHLALPMWMKFMQTALEGVSQSTMAEPDGIVRVRIDRDTGLLTNAGNPRALFEYFSEESVPVQQSPPRTNVESEGTGSELGEQLF